MFTCVVWEVALMCEIKFVGCPDYNCGCYADEYCPKLTNPANQCDSSCPHYDGCCETCIYCLPFFRCGRGN